MNMYLSKMAMALAFLFCANSVVHSQTTLTVPIGGVPKVEGCSIDMIDAAISDPHAHDNPKSIEVGVGSLYKYMKYTDKKSGAYVLVTIDRFTNEVVERQYYDEVVGLVIMKYCLVGEDCQAKYTFLSRNVNEENMGYASAHTRDFASKCFEKGIKVLTEIYLSEG